MKNSLENRVDRLCALLENVSFELPEAEYEYIEESRKLHVMMRKTLAECYENMGSAWHYASQIFTPGDIKSPDAPSFQSSDFDAWIESGTLLVKTPLLMQKAFSTIYIKDNFPVHHYLYFSFFKKPIALLLDPISQKTPDFFFDFKQKTLTYVFNYSLNAIAKDADNHDTKVVTDSIAGYFPGGDSAGSCSFSYLSAQFPDLDPGTYVAVRRGIESPTPIDFIHKSAKNRAKILRKQEE